MSKLFFEQNSKATAFVINENVINIYYKFTDANVKFVT